LQRTSLYERPMGTITTGTDTEEAYSKR